MSSQSNVSLSYRDAGVDIDAGDALVEAIKPFAKRTMREGVLGGIGGFGALFEISKKYREPVLVSGTDGVGTKLKLAFHIQRAIWLYLRFTLSYRDVEELLAERGVEVSYETVRRRRRRRQPRTPPRRRLGKGPELRPWRPDP